MQVKSLYFLMAKKGRGMKVSGSTGYLEGVLGHRNVLSEIEKYLQ